MGKHQTIKVDAIQAVTGWDRARSRRFMQRKGLEALQYARTEEIPVLEAYVLLAEADMEVSAEQAGGPDD